MVNNIQSNQRAEQLLEALHSDDPGAKRVFHKDLGYYLRVHINTGVFQSHNVNPSHYLGRAFGYHSTYLPPNPVLIPQVRLKGPDDIKHLYNVPAIAEPGMIAWDCQREETYDYLCGQIQQTINELSLRRSTARYRSVRPRPIFKNYILKEELPEEKYQFQMAVRQALLMSTLGNLHNISQCDLARIMFRDVCLTGQSPYGRDLPRQQRCQLLMQNLGVLWQPKTVWRGFSTALRVMMDMVS
jgi:hypothetical protein